jgi:hypothetical protein
MPIKDQIGLAAMLTAFFLLQVLAAFFIGKKERGKIQFSLKHAAFVMIAVNLLIFVFLLGEDRLTFFLLSGASFYLLGSYFLSNYIAGKILDTKKNLSRTSRYRQ